MKETGSVSPAELCLGKLLFLSFCFCLVLILVFCFSQKNYLNWSIVDFQCCVSFSYTYIYSVLDSPSHIGHCRVLSGVLCAIHSVLIRSLFVYIPVCVCQSQSPHLSLPLGSSFLHLWLYFHFVNKSMCTVFLDSAHKWYVCLSLFVWLHSV